jgi:hypothetical protein
VGGHDPTEIRSRALDNPIMKDAGYREYILRDAVIEEGEI